MPPTRQLSRLICPTCKGRRIFWLGGADYLRCPTCMTGNIKRCGTCGGAGQLNLGKAGVQDCPDCEAKGVLPTHHVYSYAPSATAPLGRTSVVVRRNAITPALETMRRD